MRSLVSAIVILGVAFAICFGGSSPQVNEADASIEQVAVAQPAGGSCSADCDCSDSKWHAGPMPAKTYGWGGVVPVDLKTEGFYFGDFCGDHVKLNDGRSLKPHEVKQWNNSLTLPGQSKGANQLGELQPLADPFFVTHRPPQITPVEPPLPPKPAPKPQVLPVAPLKATASPVASGHYETRYAGFRGRRSYQVWVPDNSAQGQPQTTYHPVVRYSACGPGGCR